MPPRADKLRAASPTERARAERIVRENTGLAYWGARRFHKHCPDVEMEDLEAVMLEALWTAAFGWDPSKAKLSTWAAKRMQWAAIHITQRPDRPAGLRLAPKDTRLVSLDTVTDPAILDPNLVSTPIEDWEHEHHADELHDAITNPRDRALLDRRLDGETYAEIGEQFGVTAARAHQLGQRVGRGLVAARGER